MTKSECQIAAENINRETLKISRKYKGIKMNIGTNLDVPSHWEFRYTGANWNDYFSKVKPAKALRRKLFSHSPDPITIIIKILRNAWGRAVRIAKHPTYNKEMYAGIIRSGAPKLHFDWAGFDLPGMQIVAQAGANIVISNFKKGGNLLMYQTYGMKEGNTIDSGERVIGNYDLPRQMVEGVEMQEIEYEIGDLIIAPNRFLHEVTKLNDEPEDNRIMLSTHIALMVDGSLALFS